MVWVTSSLAAVLTPTAIALGNFDGVHRGHQQVIAPIVAVQLAGQPIQPTVVSFYPHPKAFFSGQSRPALTPPDEQARVLRGLGLRQLILLPFDQHLADLSPRDFVQLLLDRLQPALISVGADFRFGQGRTGDAFLLADLAQAAGVAVNIVPLQLDAGARIASSRIRESLSQGDLLEANRLLGREYCLVGRVVAGQQLGRTLGFPTANLALPEAKFLPALGVYAVRVELEEGTIVPAVANIGCRPTIDGGSAVRVEVHLLDWTGDLYGQTLVVNLVAFLRPEQRFSSLQALQDQIALDCEAAHDRLALRVS